MKHWIGLCGAVVALSSVAVVGCSSEASGDSPSSVVESYRIAGGERLDVVQLSDGTRCAVALKKDYRGGVGIDCDWKQQ